jgi:hypothetical protein
VKTSYPNRSPNHRSRKPQVSIRVEMTWYGILIRTADANAPLPVNFGDDTFMISDDESDVERPARFRADCTPCLSPRLFLRSVSIGLGGGAHESSSPPHVVPAPPIVPSRGPVPLHGVASKKDVLSEAEEVPPGEIHSKLAVFVVITVCLLTSTSPRRPDRVQISRLGRHIP